MYVNFLLALLRSVCDFVLFVVLRREQDGFCLSQHKNIWVFQADNLFLSISPGPDLCVKSGIITGLVKTLLCSLLKESVCVCVCSCAQLILAARIRISPRKK